ncbi:hypothetical protein DRN69_02540 [Candidatus Pacearchaeota archaeon]|nr:MAG: hypothetical protein DRN69_02540 [Candidatus Pacearchaeota archaeon]
MIQRYLLNFLLFVSVVFIQVYFGMTFFISPVLNIVLIFLIFTLFYFSHFYLFFLIFISAAVLDSLSGFFWGTNLFLFLISLGAGILLIRFLEKSNFFSRLIIGGLIIFIYFLGLLIVNLILKTSHISFIIFEQFLFTLIFYMLLSFLLNKIRRLKTVHS